MGRYKIAGLCTDSVQKHRAKYLYDHRWSDSHIWLWNVYIGSSFRLTTSYKIILYTITSPTISAYTHHQKKTTSTSAKSSHVMRYDKMADQVLLLKSEDRRRKNRQTLKDATETHTGLRLPKRKPQIWGNNSSHRTIKWMA